MKKEIERLAKEVIKKFCLKHDFDYEDFETDFQNGYTHGDIWNTVNLADFYFNFSDIIYDIENNIEIDQLLKFYDYCLETEKNISFEKYLKIKDLPKRICKNCDKFIKIKGTKIFICKNTMTLNMPSQSCDYFMYKKQENQKCTEPYFLSKDKTEICMNCGKERSEHNK